MTKEEAKALGATHYMNITEVLDLNSSNDILNYHRNVNGVWQFLESSFWFDSDCEINEKFLNNLKPL